MYLDKQSFVDRSLGPGSSHPRWQARQRALYQALAFVPLLLLWCLALACLWLRGAAAFAWLLSPLWLTAALGFLAFALAATLTLSLIGRWGECQAARGVTAGPRAERTFAVDPVLAGLGIALGCVLPGAISQTAALPDLVQVLAGLLAILPSMGVLMGMSSISAPAGRDGVRVRRRPLILAMVHVVLALLALTVLHDVGVAANDKDLVRLVARFIPWYSRMGLLFLGVTVLAPLAFLLFSLWRFWVIVTPLPPAEKEEPSPSPAADGNAPPAPPAGFLARLAAWLRGTPEAAAATEGQTPAPETKEKTDETLPPGCPAWVGRLLETLAELDCAGSLPEAVRDGPASPLAEARQDLKLFFGGVLPTTDQAEAFDRFAQSWEQVVAHGAGADNPSAGPPSADILIQGTPGSGRSRLLRACALQAALVRGQRVLVLLPDEERCRFWVERLTGELESLGLGLYTRVGTLPDESGIRAWLEGAEPVPMVVTATLRAVETRLYGDPLPADQMSTRRVARLLSLFEVVIVDDLLDFPDSQRAHLPFTLDKHRLLVESEGFRVQLVVATAHLNRLALDSVGVRLFGEKAWRPQENLFALRPRPCAAAWRVNVSVSPGPEGRAVSDVVDALAGWCVREGLQAVLFRRGISPQERDRQQQDILREASGPGKIRVLTSLDEPLDDIREADAVFCEAALDGDACLAVRLNVPGPAGGVVIVSVGTAGDPAPSEAPPVLPVLVSRSASAMVSEHLRTVLRFLLPEAPVAGDTWYQFGIRFDRLPSAEPVRGDQPLFLFDVDTWVEEGLYTAQELPPMVSMRPAVARFAAIDPDNLPTSPLGVFSLSPQTFFLGQPVTAPCARVPAPRANWRGRSGQRLITTDLSRLLDLRLEYGHERYVADRIRQAEDGLELEVRPWTGRTTDAYIPVLEVGFTLSPRQCAGDLRGGPDYALEWFSLNPPGDRVHETIEVRLHGRLTDSGFASPLEDVVGYRYPGRLSALILGPARAGSDRLGERLGEALGGRWETGTGDTLLPSLTGALNYACQSRLPGLAYFARCLAFQLTGHRRRAGQAVIWVLEPWGTHATALEVFDRVMSDPEERRAFFGTVQDCLGRLAAAPDPIRLARRFARVSYMGEDKAWDLQRSQEWVAAVLTQADLQQGRGKGTPDTGAPGPQDRDWPGTPPDYEEPPPPAWVQGATATSWADCAAALAAAAVRRFPAFRTTPAGSWEYPFRLRIEFAGVAGKDWHALAREAAPEALETTVLEGTVLVAPAPHLSGEAFASALSGFLAAAFRTPPPPLGATVTLCLWILPKRDTDFARRPSLSDPFYLSLTGGLARDGLVLEEPPPRPLPPPPEPSVTPPRPGPGPYTPPDGKPTVAGTWGRALPEPGLLKTGLGATEWAWLDKGRTWQTRWGFAAASASTAYLQALDALPCRINTPAYEQYIANDPYRSEVRALASELARLHGRRDAGLPAFLLSFVQSFAYLPDPVRRGDWPRFPSEFLLMGGGDCEDSSIALVALLSALDLDAAFLQMPGHIAVGIPGPFSGTFYQHQGVKYYYAETATNSFYVPLGQATELSGPAQVIPVHRSLGAAAPLPVHVLSFDWRRGNDAVCVLHSTLPQGTVLRVTACAVRADASPQSVSGAPHLGGAETPPQPDASLLLTLPLRLDAGRLPPGSHRVDVVVWYEGAVAGLWESAAILNCT